MSSTRKPRGLRLAEWPEKRDVVRGENPVRAAHEEESRCVFFFPSLPRLEPTGPLVAAANPKAVAISLMMCEIYRGRTAAMCNGIHNARCQLFVTVSNPIIPVSFTQWLF